jgi:phage shock protein A
MADENKEKMIAGQQKKMVALDEKIGILDKKIAQLEHQKQAIANRKKEQERKQRARRLIQNGALAEKYLQREGIAPDAFEDLLKNLVSLPGITDFIKVDK